MSTSLRDAIISILSRIGAGDTSFVDELRPYYADDVHFQDPVQQVHSFEEFAALNVRLARRASELSFRIDRVTGDDDEFFVTWRMTLKPKVGPRFEVDGVSHLRTEDGKVRSHRDYWDLAELFASAIPGGRAMLALVLRPIA